MSEILRRAVFSAQADLELDVSIGVYDLLERTLSVETKRMVDNSHINLHVLAAIIDQTIHECNDMKDLEQVFCDKFQDQDLVIGLMAKYKDEIY